jgi:serine/threonine protein kinase
MLEVDPRKRISIVDILAHSWLKNTPEQEDLFNEHEKELIRKEFTYNDASRYNRNES